MNVFGAIDFFFVVDFRVGVFLKIITYSFRKNPCLRICEGSPVLTGGVPTMELLRHPLAKCALSFLLLLMSSSQDSGPDVPDPL